VEDHAPDGDLGLELVEQVPGDRLALAVLIGGEVELVGVLEGALELGHLLLLVRVDDVVRLEVALDVDRELAVGTLLHLRGQLGGLRKVTNVPDARLDVELWPEIAADGARLRGRLDDHELAGTGHRLPSFIHRGCRGDGT